MFVTQKRNRSLVAMTLFIATLVPVGGVCASKVPSKVPSKEVVVSFIEAYNNHNVDKMLEHCSDDVRWLTVERDAISLEADGKETLRSTMQSHFEDSPNASSALLVVEGDGPMVVAIEKATLKKIEPARSQCSASVYQLKNGLIENVWYFDVYQCTKPE